MKEFLNKLSGDVIGAAIEVHRELGAGLLEVTYEIALQHELYLRGICSERQVLLPVRYKDLELPDSYRVDLLVENSLVVEIKAVEQIIPLHSAQLLTYLKMSKNHLGLLINFHTIQLTDGIKRVVHNFPR
jgi:GxxExxY protein